MKLIKTFVIIWLTCTSVQDVNANEENRNAQDSTAIEESVDHLILDEVEDEIEDAQRAFNPFGKAIDDAGDSVEKKIKKIRIF